MKDNSYIALWSLAEKHQFINTRTLSVWVFMNYFTIRFPQYARVCLKNHSCHLHAPLCGRFAPNSGYIARYAPFIWHKSPTKCDAHLTKSIFKTRSSTTANFENTFHYYLCFHRYSEYRLNILVKLNNILLILLFL